ncbi:Protein HemX [Polaromonas vacuolata]|uniref:Protein HemX n=1 Tax=Polaromonas vacuolata TaxID=37448 RepID=A0A6H2H7L1_9BURK|nr:uroporphyrinogen-III C-methyltransferase [Polaromonas vacuolata]QJC55486.1 Protein HemX [Polaromonas vacuolata]
MSESKPAPNSQIELDEKARLATPVIEADIPFWRLSRFWLLLMLALAAAGLIASILLWQKLYSIQEELARRSLDSGTQSIEARALARQAQDSSRELAVRLGLLETRIGEVSLQRSQLEELMQSLSRSRDENLVIDIESTIRLAQQQSQLTGSSEPLIAALTSASQRLARAAQPRLYPLQRAVAKDTERIKSASLTDVPALMLKLDELVRLADDLSMANAMRASVSSRPQTATAESAPLSAASTSGITGLAFFDKMTLPVWVGGALTSLRDSVGQLLRLSRIDQPEGVLLSPEQSFFLRENFKLKLLNARLALLSRQTDGARGDLQNASAWLNKYFDPNSRKTQLAAQMLQQAQAQLKTSDLPRLDDTMTALATATAGH